MQHIQHHQQLVSQQNGNLVSPITPSAAMLSKLPFGNHCNNKTNPKNSCSSIPIGPKKTSSGGGNICSLVSPSVAKCASTPTQGSPASVKTQPSHTQSTDISPQSTNQTPAPTPTKAIRAPRPSSTSSIPQISGPSVSTKTSVILRNKNNVSNQQTIVDKIKQYNKSGQQIANSEQNSSQTVVNNKCEPIVPKRTSSSSGFSSAKSDSSASLCGLETSVSTVATIKTKPSVTPSGGPKTRANNYSQNTYLALNASPNASPNTNSNISYNLSNNHILKKSEEILNTNDNKTNVCNSNRNPSNSSAKYGSIPVKRIQPPRSRPMSTIIDNTALPLAMTSNSESTSNTSLTAIAKQTAAVKATYKELPPNDTIGRVTTGRKFEGQSPVAEQTSYCNSNIKMKSSEKFSQQPIGCPKPEPSIAMVSPIMAREQNKSVVKNDTFEDEKRSKTQRKQMQIESKVSHIKRDGVKQSDNKQTNSEEKRCDQQKESPQQQQENGLQDSNSSSHEEESAGNSDVESALVNIKPMPLLARTLQFAYLKSSANSNHSPNGSVYSKFPNNYSAIENGYQSDCTQLDCQSRNSRPNTYKNCHSTTSASNRYLNQSDVCPPQLNTQGSSHRQYSDTDSAANANAIRAANLFDLMHSKHSTSNNTYFPSHPSFCLDDSSSLSSDAGMISGTEVSGTTTSSMSSSTGADPMGQYMAKSSAKSKGAVKSKSCKKTDSSMQTESMSTLSSTGVWKRYLHEHHLMMRANSTVAPKSSRNLSINTEEGTKSLDRLETRLNNLSNNKKLINNSKSIERHDSFDSMKHGMNKNNFKHDLNLMSNKRPLSSPSSQRTAVTTTPGLLLKQYMVQRSIHKSKSNGSPQTDSTQSDTEFVQQKQQNNYQYFMSNHKYPYMTSPARQRDISSRLSSYADIGGYGSGMEGQFDGGQSAVSPWLQRHALAFQRNAMTEAESLESLNGPLSLDSNYMMPRQHSTPPPPNSPNPRLRETASSSPAFSSSQNRSKDHLIRNGSIRLNKCSEPTSQPTSPTRFANHVYSSPNHDSSLMTNCGQRSLTSNGAINQYNHNFKEEDLIHGSSLSLVSTSSMFSAMKAKKKSKTAKILNNSSSGWLRSSFSKAFKKNKSFVKRDALSDAEVMGNGSGTEGDSSSVPNSPPMSSRPFHSDLNSNTNDLNESDEVQVLKRQLREKDMILTDLRLESLTSALQLENLKETVNQLRAEILTLQQQKSLPLNHNSMQNQVHPN
ncbi:unnamed protein product [Oppiella nova]|uniref:Neuron navigator 2 n=1 Tax=Oppiella nova TaxID=334625 RepID=A0A7R9QD03_9ACAR|nr:unnamed protein product [Oppiella nova]CAG2163335.1 unnamed protein product [Oppiella nova]